MSLRVALVLVLLVGTSVVSCLSPAMAKTVCSIADSQISSPTGVTATKDGYFVVNNKGEDLRIYQLDNKCATQDVQIYSEIPRELEDLTRTSNGTLWAADIGDPNGDRATVAIWAISSRADVLLYRLKYPDGPHDAKAFLITDDGLPLIVTKDSTGTAGLYSPAESLTGPARTINLRNMGSLTIQPTGTKGGPPSGGQANQVTITGGAVSHDGKKAVLRTYTDAYEWDIPNGDFSNALTSAQPRRTTLPNEPMGEAVGYSSDDKKFVTLSKQRGTLIRQWDRVDEGNEEDKVKDSEANNGGISLSQLSLQDIMRAVFIVGGLGLLLLIVGIVGIVRFRRAAKAIPGLPSQIDESPNDYIEEDDYRDEYDPEMDAEIFEEPAEGVRRTPLPPQLGRGPLPQLPPGAPPLSPPADNPPGRGRVYGSGIRHPSPMSERALDNTHPQWDDRNNQID